MIVDNLCVGLDGNADAKLSVTGDISGQVSSDSITLFEVGLPGLSVPKYVAQVRDFIQWIATHA